jgi:hypothetical protein
MQGSRKLDYGGELDAADISARLIADAVRKLAGPGRGRH